jgi:hypothetical protein
LKGESLVQHIVFLNDEASKDETKTAITGSFLLREVLHSVEDNLIESKWWTSEEYGSALKFLLDIPKSLLTEQLQAELQLTKLQAEQQLTKLQAEQLLTKLQAEQQLTKLQAEQLLTKLQAEQQLIILQAEQLLTKLQAEQQLPILQAEQLLTKLQAEQQLTKLQAEQQLIILQAEQLLTKLQAEQQLPILQAEQLLTKLQAQQLLTKLQAEQLLTKVQAEQLLIKQRQGEQVDALYEVQHFYKVKNCIEINDLKNVTKKLIVVLFNLLLNNQIIDIDSFLAWADDGRDNSEVYSGRTDAILHTTKFIMVLRQLVLEEIEEEEEEIDAPRQVYVKTEKKL